MTPPDIDAIIARLPPAVQIHTTEMVRNRGMCFPVGKHVAWRWGVFLARALHLQPHWARDIDEMLAARNLMR